MKEFLDVKPNLCGSSCTSQMLNHIKAKIFFTTNLAIPVDLIALCANSYGVAPSF